MDGQVIGGPQATIYTYDQYGNGGYYGQLPVGGLQPGQFVGNYQNTFLNAQSQGDAATRQRMANAIDPVTGELRVHPQTQSDWAEVERQAQLLQSSNARMAFASEAKLLGFNDQTIAAMSQGGGGLLNGTGGTGAGGGVAPMGNAQTQDPALYNAFSTALLKQLNSTGLDPATLQDIINRGNEGLSTAQAGDERTLQMQAARSGFGNSGDLLRGIQDIGTKYAGMKADNARQASVASAQQALQIQSSALGQAGNYEQGLNSLAHSNNLAMVDLLNKQANASVPNVGGGGYGQQNPIGPSFGGGANSNSGNQGGMTNSRAPQMFANPPQAPIQPPQPPLPPVPPPMPPVPPVPPMPPVNPPGNPPQNPQNPPRPPVPVNNDPYAQRIEWQGLVSGNGSANNGAGYPPVSSGNFNNSLNQMLSAYGPRGVGAAGGVKRNTPAQIIGGGGGGYNF